MESDSLQKTPKLGDLKFGPDIDKPLGGLNPYSAAFDEIGKQYFKLLLEHVNLNPNTRILDIGCGTGRLAKQLVSYSKKDRYCGIDNNINYIAHCQNSYPFKFVHHDVQHEEFNSTGQLNPNTAELPYQPKSFDLVVCLGIFNHFQLPWVSHYISEISRILKFNGQLFSTILLINPLSNEFIQSGKAKKPFRFKYNEGDTWYESKDRQLLNVAFSEKEVRRIYLKNSLMIREPIRYGHWCGSTNAFIGHDIIIARKDKF